MEYTNLFEAIKNFENDFYNTPVDIVSGYSFSQYKTVKRIVLYYSGKFEQSSEDNRYFHNISRDKVRNGIKNIDIDTKDLQIISKNPVRDKLKKWIVKQKIKTTFKKIKLGVKMNEATEYFCQFGTLVLKKNLKTQQFVDIVDLRNLICEPTAKSLKDSPYVIEDHYLLPNELLEISKDWENTDEVDKLIKNHKKSKNVAKQGADPNGLVGSDLYINIKEVYGIIPESWIVDGGDEKKYVRVKLICSFEDNEQGDGGWLLWHKIISEKDWVYKEVHFDQIKGRWLGIGLVEEVFEPQVRKNEVVNLRFSAMRFAALMLLQTQDNTVLRNILSDLENGDILTMNQLLTRVPTEMRDHAVFQMEDQDIEKNAAKLTNSFEVTSGSSLPSGTPYSLGALLDRNANKYYEFIRENYGLFWQDVVMDWIMPYSMKDFDKAELLKMTDPDMLIWVKEEFAQAMMWKTIKKYILNLGRVPNQEELDLIKEGVMAKFTNEATLEIPESYLKDYKYDLDLLVTGEQVNKQQMIMTMSTVLQMLAQNPQILENPLTKRLFTSLLDISGIDIGGIGMAQVPENVPAPVPTEAVNGLVQASGSAPLPVPQSPQR